MAEGKQKQVYIPKSIKGHGGDKEEFTKYARTKASLGIEPVF